MLLMVNEDHPTINEFVMQLHYDTVIAAASSAMDSDI